ncbi:PilZ domain-containing protein [Sphingomonas sp. TREG-RG-20F-R18-01]|uniref:PilZ domain-containing protein n=1 Tax=Sphingomonas sp. TREG-RG-20F-R18-01 TaxID=2914982 RepID=UPI001F5ABA31|nr:PilZ domain-containing protein [Sphingomonas sp. TREG-RG-20F-R18-01]
MRILTGRNDLRAARRYKIFKPGFFARKGTSSSIHLLNISKSGAKAHAEQPPREGDRVMIECDFSLGEARVLWVSANRFGLQFVIPLSENSLAQVVG